MPKQSTKTTVRTVLQAALGIAVVLPAIVTAAGIPQALPWVAGALAVAGAVTRVMALPGVQRILPSWLRTTTPGTSDADLTALARSGGGRR